jgi:hypothetical protein
MIANLQREARKTRANESDDLWAYKYSIMHL